MNGVWRWMLPALLVLVFALTRWPGLMPPNFSAAYALAFCAAVYFPARTGWLVALAALLATDLLLNLFYYRVEPFSVYMAANYLGFAGIIFLGRQFSPRTPWLGLLAGGLAGAILFYLVSNTAAWVQNPAYAKNLAGWIQALTTGTLGPPPTWQFFRNTLLSSGLFVSLFVGVMKWRGSFEADDAKEPAGEDQAEEPKPAS